MRTCLPAILFLLPLSPIVQAQEGTVFWEKDVASALDRAKRVQRPILAAFHAPGNKGSRAFLKKTYLDPALRRYFREYVCIVGTEKPFPKIESGDRKGMSSAFLTLSFEEAKKVAQALREKYLGQGEVTVPQHLILDSKGRLVDRREGHLDAKALQAFLAQGLDKISPDWNPAPLKKTESPVKSAAPAKLLTSDLLFTGSAEQKNQLIDQLLASDAKVSLLELYPRIVSEATKTLVLSKIRFAKGDLTWHEPILLAALKDSAAIVRAHAAVNCAGLRLPRLAAPLLKAAKAEKVTDRASDKEVEAIGELIQALAACGKGHRSTRKWLFGLEKHRNSAVRTVFFVSMASWGKESKEKKVRSLLYGEGLQDSDWAVRSGAIWSLAEIRYKKAAPEIKRMLARTTRDWRKEIYALALARIEGKNQSPDRWRKARVELTGEKIRRPWGLPDEG